MIIGIVNETEFQKAGLDFINLSLDQVFALYEHFEESKFEELEMNEEAQLFWESRKDH